MVLINSKDKKVYRTEESLPKGSKLNLENGKLGMVK